MKITQKLFHNRNKQRKDKWGFDQWGWLIFKYKRPLWFYKNLVTVVREKICSKNIQFRDNVMRLDKWYWYYYWERRTRRWRREQIYAQTDVDFHLTIENFINIYKSLFRQGIYTNRPEAENNLKYIFKFRNIWRILDLDYI